MVAMDWTYPLYKITCASEKMIPLNTSFSELLSKAQCRAGNCFYLQGSLSQTKRLLNLDISSQSLAPIIFYLSHIAVASEWVSLRHLLSTLPPGLSCKKVYLIMSFSCSETFSQTWSFSPQSLFGLNPSPGPLFLFQHANLTLQS